MNARDLKAIEWKGEARVGVLHLLDQRVLPNEEVWLRCGTVSDVAEAIRTMVVRGAPAIGIAAAYGMVFAAREVETLQLEGDEALAVIQSARAELASTRPTAVNLFWALERCARRAKTVRTAAAMLELAQTIHREDIAGNLRIGELGAERIEDGMGILTHCNAGALATGGFGTALAPIYVAHEQGKRIHVYVDETRPRLQGARLTAWELSRVGVPFTLICDGAAASLMARGKIQMCITGADRIAANGDTANKVGTYSVAVNAAHHRIPFDVAAPLSTIDLATVDGAAIPIEERAAGEIKQIGAETVSPREAPVFNPAFDVTPSRLIRSIITELGVIGPVTRDEILEVARSSRHTVVEPLGELEDG